LAEDGGADRRDDQAEAEAGNEQGEREAEKVRGGVPAGHADEAEAGERQPEGSGRAEAKTGAEHAAGDGAEGQGNRKAHEVETAIQGGAAEDNVGEQGHVNHRNDQSAA
jgi:hypothetical protein